MKWFELIQVSSRARAVAAPANHFVGDPISESHTNTDVTRMLDPEDSEQLVSTADAGARVLTVHGLVDRTQIANEGAQAEFNIDVINESNVVDDIQVNLFNKNRACQNLSTSLSWEQDFFYWFFYLCFLFYWTRSWDLNFKWNEKLVGLCCSKHVTQRP